MPLVFDDESNSSGGHLVFDDAESGTKKNTGIIEGIKNFGVRFIDNEVAGIDASAKRDRQKQYDSANALNNASLAAQTTGLNPAEVEQRNQAIQSQDAYKSSVGGNVADAIGGGGQLARDLSLGFVKGGVNTVVKLPVALGGIAEDATGTRSSLESIGYRSKDALGVIDQFGKWMDSLKSDSGQARDRDFNATKGMVDTLGELGASPAMVMDKVSESLVGIGVIGKTAGAAVESFLPRLAAQAKAAGLTGTAAEDFIAQGAAKVAQIAAPVSEGLQSGLDIAGTAQEAGRSLDQYGKAALAGGLGTAAIGMASNKLGAKFGIGDVETDIALRGTGSKVAKTGPGSAAERFFKEGAKEGLAEELPQSVNEAIAENVAMGRPWDQGVGKSAAAGAVAGFAMGGGHTAFGHGDTAPTKPDAPQEETQKPPVATGNIAPDATNKAAAPEVSAAEKALLTPVELTSLDRVNEIDKQGAELAAREAELSDKNGYGPMFDGERQQLATQRAELESEKQTLTKNWPKAIEGAPSSFTTEAGARVEAKYALMDAADLVTSHDTGLRKNPAYPQELQPRERDRAASEMQVSGIVQKLDPARLGLSADAANGAPIVGADGLVESGNARTIALMRVYQANGQKASDYKQFLRDNAAQFGITPESVDSLQKPVLVRVRTTPVNRAEFARQANASTVAAMSPSEQAKSDSSRIDSMEDLTPDDQGDFSNAASKPFIRRFMARLPATEQAGMIDSAGNLSTAGYARVRNAVLAKAYGDSPVLQRMTESMDDNLRNVSRALMLAAPKVAAMREAVGAGNRFDADITPDLMSAVEELSRLKDAGSSVEDALAQAGMFGDKYSPETAALLQFLSTNMRRPRKIADFIGAYMDALDAAGDPNQGSLLDDTPAPAKQDLLKAAERNTQDATQDTQRGIAGKDAKPGAQTGSQPENAPGDQGGAQGDGVTGRDTRLSRQQDTKPVGEQSEWVDFPKDSGTIGIPRADMPQVKGEHRGALIQFLQARGIDHKTEDVQASSLKPTQAEFSTKKAARWSEVRDGVDRSVLVSNDGHILDGHHQWVAALAANEPVKAIVLDAPIRELMTNVFQFPSVRQSDDSATAKADPRKMARQDFKQAMAELADLVADTLGTRVMMMPPNNAKLQAILVKLFDSAIRVVGTDLKAATKWVKAQLKGDPDTKPWWNKITDKDYQTAALAALEQSTKEHVDDLFAAAEARQADMFSDAPAAPKVAMIDGRAYNYAQKGGDNYQAPETTAFMSADVLDNTKAFIKATPFSAFKAVISSEDRATAEAMLKPMLEKADAAKVEYDQKVIDIAKRTGALGQQLAPLKSLDRGAEKLALEPRLETGEMDSSSMKDLLRSTIVVSEYQDAQSVLDEIAKEFEVMRIKNRSGVELTGKNLKSDSRQKFGGYSDVLVNVILPNGTVAEIQINVPEMLGAKYAEGHTLYEIARVQKPDSELLPVIDGVSQKFYDDAFAAKDAGGVDRKQIPSSGPLVIAGQGSNDASSSENLNQLPSGKRTNSSPPNVGTNEQPGGNLSGTLISPSFKNIIAKISENGYSQPDLLGERDVNDTDGAPGAQGKGAGTVQGSAGKGKAQRARSGSSGPNLIDNGGPDAGTAAAGEVGQPGNDGVRGQNENGKRAQSGDSNGRSAGVPAGREIPAKSGLNYEFGDDDLTYEGSWPKKAAANVDAVELLKKLESEKRQATREEQKILAKFVGWGSSELANNLFGAKLDKAAQAMEAYSDAIEALGQSTSVTNSNYSRYAPAFKVLQFANPNLTWYNAGTITRDMLDKARPDAATQRWLALRDRLKAALTPEEWAEASRSTQYAHYTSKGVVKSMWRALERMGFKGGSMLEPGAGIGVFPGLMSAAMATNTAYTGIEYDSVTGGILKQLFPDERILVESFVDSKLPKNFFDVAVGNPPFSGTKILGDPEYAKQALSLHDYFFAKSIDRVKPGGIVAYVTSRYTMDKLDDKARKYLSDRADLVGAIRLPQTAFKQNAGTDVVTDVIFLRKKVPGETFAGAQAWGKSVPIVAGAKTFPINEYFHAHPEMVLGKHSDQGKMQNSVEPQYTVEALPGDIETHFAKAVENLPADVYRAERGSAGEAAKVREIDFNPKAQKEGNFYVTDAGVLMVRESGVGMRAEEKHARNADVIKAFVPLRDALKQAHYDQLNDGDWETSLAKLRKEYDAFTKAHGQINQFSTKMVNTTVTDEETGEKFTDQEARRTYTLLKKIEDDPDWTLVAALENVNDDTGIITPGKFLSERVLGKPAAATVSTPTDALLSVLNDVGHVDIPTIASRLNISEADAIEALGSSVYEDPETGWTTFDEYTSGNVKRKLESAKAAAKADKAFERNIAVLEAAQPDPKTPSQINASMGMNWIPGTVYSDFLREVAGVSANVEWNARTKQWIVEESAGGSTLKATADWGTDRRNTTALVEHALTGRKIHIESSTGSGKDKVTYTDTAAIEAANAMLAKLQDEFQNWLWKDAGRTEMLVRSFNDKFNTTVPRSFDGRHLTLPGSSTQFHIFDHVKRGAWRIIAKGNTYLAHAVGSGKTFQMVISAMEQKRLGLIKKPMMVVPNHMLQQFAREWQELYPAARLMVADENNFHMDNRRRFVSRVALSDLDGVVITQSAFKILDLDPEFKKKMIQEQLDYMRAALEEAGGNPDSIRMVEDGVKKDGTVKWKLEGSKSRDPKIKQIEKQIENMEQKLIAATSSVGKDQNARFDELGVDFLYVDEAHNYRKLDFTTNRDVKGLSPTGSGMAFDLYMKSTYLETKTPGRSLVMASGTPVTNTVAELYTVQKFMDRQALVDRGIDDFDSWAAMFGREKTALEPNAAGKYEPVTRFSKFVNVPELTQMFREYADVLNSDHLAALLGDKRPKVEGGSRKIIVTPKTDAYAEYQSVLSKRVEDSRNWKPTKEEPNNPDPIIKIIGDGRLAAIDMRFMDPSLPSDPDSKLNRLADDVINTFKETSALEYKDKADKVEPNKGASMMVFSDLGFGAGVAASRGFNARAWLEKRLRDAGVPMDQVAFMSDYKKSSDKLKLFKDVNAGRVRVLVGSSKNMGTGVNAQQRLAALFHLDSPWYPADLEQREGRIVRQGNKNPLVKLFAYAAKGTYDENMWKMLASKQFFIDQALSGDANLREIEDLDSQSQYDLAAAMVADDPRILQLAGAKADIEKMQRLYQAHEQQRMGFVRQYTEARATVDWANANMKAAIEVAGQVIDLSGDKFVAKAGGKTFTVRTDWAQALIDRYKDLAGQGMIQTQTVGEISGFKVAFAADNIGGQYMARLMLETPEQVVLASDAGTSLVGMTMRATNTLAGLSMVPAKLRERISEARARMDALSTRLETPFPMAELLAEKTREADALEREIIAGDAVVSETGFPWETLSDEDYSAGAGMGMVGETYLSRGKGGGMDLKALKALAYRIRSNMPNMPDVHVLESPAQAPKALRDYIEQQGAMADVEGAMHNGALYLFASGLSDPLRAEHVLAEHEAAHFGLRAILGSSLKTSMLMIYNNNTYIRQLATELQKRGKLSNAEATEEAIVDIPSSRLVKLQGWRKVVLSARDWLAGHGFEKMAEKLGAWLDGNLTDQQRADMFVANLVRAARGYVAGKHEGKFSTVTGTMLSGTLAEDIAKQEKWLSAEAKARGYADIDQLAEKNYPLFEKLAAMWRQKNPAENGVLLSRAPVQGTAAERADKIIQTNAATAKPIDLVAKTLTRITGIERLTGAIYNRAGYLLDRYTPEMVKAGLVADYGVPGAVIDQRALMQGHQRVQLRKAGELIDKLSMLTREESRVAYEWMNETDPKQIYAMMQNLPEESVKVLMDVQAMIDKLSKEAVRMGQLSPEAYEANKFAYLRRSYAKYTLGQTAGEKVSRARAISILGEQYKGRGLTEAATMKQIQNIAPEWWKRKMVAGKADTSLKGEKLVRLERRAPSGERVGVLPGVDGNKQAGKLLEVHYFPASETLPAKYADWTRAATFEVRDVKGDKVVLWRDFTKDEREKMGEIDEARFAIAKTLHGMIHDVEVGRHLEWLAHNYAKKEGETIPGEVVDASERYKDTFAPGTWVRVPDSKIPGTAVQKYGKLAGRYLPGPVWNDLRQTVNGQFKPFGDTYAKLLSWWKTSKTALSPAVHTNNIMSNFVMADWHDVTAGHTAKALRILMAAHQGDGKGVLGTVGNKLAGAVGMVDREAAREIMIRYQDSGGDIGSWATNEIAQGQIEPMLEAMEKELAATNGSSAQAQVGVYQALQHALLMRFPSALEALKGSKPGKAVATEGGTLIDMYQSEDDVFRLAAWLKAKEEGRTDMEAGKVARRSFMDYHINAPWVQAVRNSALPFISYTYRAVPMMLEIAGKKPHKLLKLMAFAGALNAFGLLLAGGGDDDKERKLLPEEKAGRIWGLVPKLIRMPWNDTNGSPVYLDIRRFIPVGDVFDIGAGHSAVPILPMMQIGGPLAIAGELYANKSNFTGKPIVLETDTGVQKTKKVLDFLYKALAPNIIGLPGTYATTGVMDAAAGKTDAFGRQQSTAQAVASSFGVKLGSYPADVLAKNLRGKAQAEIMEIDHNISKLKRQRQMNGISAADFESQVKTEQEKKVKVMQELAEKLK